MSSTQYNKINKLNLVTAIKEQRKQKLTSQKLGLKMDYRCPLEDCGKVFKQYNSLQKHIRVHTGEKPYKCTFKGCSKAFTQTSNLKRHMKIHTGEKSFKCLVCSKSYVTLSNLVQHEQIHLSRNNRKVYECSVAYCHKSFYHKCSLIKHLAKVHGKDASHYKPKQNHVVSISSSQNNNSIFKKFSLLVKSEIKKIQETVAIVQQKEQVVDFNIFAKDPINESTTAMTSMNQEQFSQISELDFQGIGLEFDSLFEDISLGNKRKASQLSCQSALFEEPEITKKEHKKQINLESFNFNFSLGNQKESNEIFNNDFSVGNNEQANDIFSELFDNNEDLFVSDIVPQTFFAEGSI